MAHLCAKCRYGVELTDRYERVIHQRGQNMVHYSFHVSSDRGLGGDTLPDLPRLKQSGDGPSGCDFCRLMRHWILEYFTKTKPTTLALPITTAYLIGHDAHPERRQDDPYFGPVALRVWLGHPLDGNARKLIHAVHLIRKLSLH